MWVTRSENSGISPSYQTKYFSIQVVYQKKHSVATFYINMIKKDVSRGYGCCCMMWYEYVGIQY